MHNLRLFGPFTLAPQVQPLSRKGQWLLGLLALRRGRDVERAWLAGTLWPDTSEELSLYNLRRELSAVRRALGPHKGRVLSPGARVLSLDVSSAWVDVVAFDEAVVRGDEGSLEQAVDVYVGPLLEGCSEPWIYEEREARAQAYLEALEALAAHASSGGNAAAAVRYLKLAVAADPLRESAHRGLIQALAATGAYAAATTAYRDLRMELQRELQVEPSPETRAVHQRTVADARTKASPRAAPCGTIPRPLTRWIGRAEDLGDVASRVVSSRLVTLVGTGGVGKSRLAIEVTRALATQFDAGACFVELAALSDPGLVPSSVATAVGLHNVTARPLLELLSDFFRDRKMLIVLDNCEHVLGACAELALRLLSVSAELHFLVTTRQPLGIVGEVVWRVPSLTAAHAVELFLERAEAPLLSPLSASIDTVELVCRRLDGIPFAIELAAARTRALSIEQIATRLDDRFQLLTSGSRTALPRHRTLRATMEWSYHLLSAAEQTLLRTLSVFSGGWTFEAAEHVAGDSVLEPLSGLVEKSLVVFEGRYRLLETVRQYAYERLSESDEETAIRDRHLAYFVDLAERAAAPLFGGGADRAWLDRLDEEHDNVRAALDWAEANEAGAESALRLVAAVHWFWFARSHAAEGWCRVVAALRRRDGVSDAVKARSLAAAGFVAMWLGDFGAMRAPLTEALTIAEGSGDAWLRSYALIGLGAAALFAGDATEARPRFEQATAIARGIEPRTLHCFSLYWLGTVDEALADFAAARQALLEGIELTRRIGHKTGLAHMIYRLGHCAHAQGEYGEARVHYGASLEVLVETADLWGTAMAIDGLGFLAASEGDAARAARLLGAAEALRRRIGAEVLPSDRKDYDRAVGAARRAYGEEAFEAAWAEGGGLSLDAAIALATLPGRP